MKTIRIKTNSLQQLQDDLREAARLIAGHGPPDSGDHQPSQSMREHDGLALRLTEYADGAKEGK